MICAMSFAHSSKTRNMGLLPAAAALFSINEETDAAVIAVQIRKGGISANMEKTMEEKRYMEQTYGAKIHISTCKIPHVSSTEIRRRLLCGQPISQYVPKSVERYLLENEVYHAQ